MTIRILRAALQDLEAGSNFYDELQAGLGAHFFDSLYSDIRGLATRAGVHVAREGYFRALAERFPYAIYYQVNGDCVEVVAVLDCRRSPRWIQVRLKDRD